MHRSRKSSFRRFIGFSCVVATSLGVGCDARENDAETRSVTRGGETGQAVRSAASAPAPQLLYLPEEGDVALGSEYAERKPGSPLAFASKARRCPSEMVDVGGAFCIDRFEAQLVDVATGEPLSPYYPPEPSQAAKLRDHWEAERGRAARGLGRELSVPELPRAQSSGHLEPRAASVGGVVPSGYLDGFVAERACKNAGKRLCSASEWVTACRGEKNRAFPYGDRYEDGACNVNREAHPAALLHGNASEGHLDPRLNLVASAKGPLLRKTGASSACRSEWGGDAVYDMVGNLDEWVDDENGAFHGGFYSRGTRLGCDARISSHPRPYEDYSLGVRCCR